LQAIGADGLVELQNKVLNTSKALGTMAVDKVSGKDKQMKREAAAQQADYNQKQAAAQRSAAANALAQENERIEGERMSAGSGVKNFTDRWRWP